MFRLVAETTRTMQLIVCNQVDWDNQLERMDRAEM
ncbi:hypothetical protein C7964_101844 [Loktanella sp. PT4BL]|nr:hypothetical protein C7964_101844 [Loktanella sp. PT4BL]